MTNEPKKTTEEPNNPSSQEINRRKLLRDTGLVGGSLLLAALAGDVEAQQKTIRQKAPTLSPKQQAIDKILLEAMRTRNIKTAIKKYGAPLTADEKKALQRLTAADLTALKNIKDKLGDIGTAAHVTGGSLF